METVVPVVLAGGKGVRLWPVSREACPKPLVRALASEETMLQATVRRASGLGGGGRTMVVCNVEHDCIVGSQARMAARHGVRLILEPEGRNTAPAVCVAALVQSASGSDDPLLVLPADHAIRDEERFVEAVRSARQLAMAGHLVTFAIAPTFPATGYGYLKIGRPISEARRQFHIDAFIEKPPADVARKLVDGGQHAWNSGMFMFRPSVLVRAFEELQPEILEACRRAIPRGQWGEIVRLDGEAFGRSPAISIDQGIMEKSSNIATVLADFDWSDVGDWQAVWSITDKDDRGNAVIGHVEVVESSGSLLHSDGPLLVGVGLVDMIAVATRDAVVVAPRQRSQEIKQAVEILRSHGRPAAAGGLRVYRPWGSFEQLHEGAGFRVKELMVLPGAKLSLQRHRFRAEHWVCIGGEGYAVRDSERIRLSTGESVFIPLGAIHRLENPGTDVLRIVEIQIGNSTDEDDIERFEDIYGRV